MQENYEHYISRTIKKLYRKRLAAPVLYLIFTAILFGTLPISSVLFPSSLKRLSDLDSFFHKNDRFVSVSLENLHFTGYTRTRFHRTSGYFYYAYNPDQNECCIVLLSPSTCEEGLPNIEQTSVYAKILPSDASYETLLSNLSKDLDWTDAGIRSKVSACYLSEPDFHYYSGMFLFVLLAFGAAFAALSIFLFLLYMAKPHVSPPCQKLRYFGNPKNMLALAEEELATLPQLATEDMFITEHFFIETSRYGVALIPIQEIVWIYKHSTLQKLFWYHFSISYTLHIIANRHVCIRCPKNMKSDIDGIIDYLSEANHDILVGFSEENRRLVHGK